MPPMPRFKVLWSARPYVTRPYVVDAALAALVLCAVSLQFLFPEEGGDELTWGGFALGAGTAVPLVWRRRAPFGCAAVIAFFTPAMALYHRPPPDICFGGMVALYTVAAIGSPWKRRVMLAGWLTGAAVTMAFKEHAEPYEYPFHLLSLISAYALGAFARVQRAYTAAIEDRARRLERERAGETARAVTQERARIARDMHDILAHAVSLMVVQAEAGPVVVRSDPARAEGAFDAIAGAGRDAMVQLRRILGVLREPSVPGELGPQPTLAALPELAVVVEQAGVRVELGVDGVSRPLPPDVEVAAYRIVQEALTNCVKHAAAQEVRVQLGWGDEELVITVVDDGAGTVAVDGRSGAGHGLIGIHERAAACGGTAEAGDGPDGGFRVAARLPTASLGDEHPGGGRRRPGAGAQRLLDDPRGTARHRGGGGGG
ncbi:sensor histidine kinase [Streptomyces sp. NPDC050844]|uniref:sensor histidine kinase n=1 Tax=Streptomyces sp. NPDC050844 TaxID=3155790 RepID=UPI0033E36216